MPEWKRETATANSGVEAHTLDAGILAFVLQLRYSVTYPQRVEFVTLAEPVRVGVMAVRSGLIWGNSTRFNHFISNVFGTLYSTLLVYMFYH